MLSVASRSGSCSGRMNTGPLSISDISLRVAILICPILAEFAEYLPCAIHAHAG
jgi:hypothetical protein